MNELVGEIRIECLYIKIKNNYHIRIYINKSV